MENAILTAKTNNAIIHRLGRVMGAVPVYLEFAKKSFQLQLQYRIANYSGFIVNIFFFLVRAYVFMALYEHRGNVAGYDLVDAITFTGITQAIIMVIGIFGRSAGEIGGAVRSGQVATDLMKPIDYQLFALSNQLGQSTYYLFFRGLPIFAVMALFFPWKYPHSWLALSLFFLSLFFATIIIFSFSFMIGLSAFWLLDISGIRQLVTGTGMFLSGFLIPISFFPDAFGRICEWLPFIGQSYVPVAIYLGKYTGLKMINMLARQIIWAVILLSLGRLFMSFSIRKLIIQGG
jgi:ABC-2 type transport system permease protein